MKNGKKKPKQLINKKPPNPMGTKEENRKICFIS